MYILICIIGICIGSLLTYLFIAPKLKKHEKINQDILHYQEQLILDNQNLFKEQESLIKQKELLKTSIADLEEQAQKASDIFFKQEQEKAEIQLKADLDAKKQYYLNEIDSYEKEYLAVLEQSVDSYCAESQNLEDKIKTLTNKYNDLYSITQAAIEANKRRKEIEDQSRFYCLNLSSEDLQEIQQLRDISTNLRNAEPLNKVIWKTYYEKPYTDLIGRVIGNTPKTGIYKITNLTNQMCYVGQAVKYWPVKNFSQLLLRVN